MRQNIVVLFCILFTLSACGSPEAPEILLHIEGTVTNAKNGEPREGAYIRLFEIFDGFTDASTWANREGKYVLLYNTKCLLCEFSVVADLGGEGRVKGIGVTNQIQIIDFQY